MIDLSLLEEKLEYSFKDRKLLENAITHSSYVNELQVKTREDNERLEFLGDAVLELVSSEYIYNRFKGKSEGELSKLRAYAVCEEALFERGKKLELGSFLLLGTGARKQGCADRPSTVSDAVEAVIAAIFLDGGFEPAKKFVLGKILADTDFESYEMDPKTAIQQYFQSNPPFDTVKYDVISDEGPSNNKTFVVQARVSTLVLEKGKGRSLRNAEKDAARRSLEKLKKR